jgi:hypothetical protein
MNGEPEDFEAEGIDCAVGNHMNFLRINSTILFPYFSDEISQKPLQDFISLLKNNNLNINVIVSVLPTLSFRSAFASK